MATVSLYLLFPLVLLLISFFQSANSYTLDYHDLYPPAKSRTLDYHDWYNLYIPVRDFSVHWHKQLLDRTYLHMRRKPLPPRSLVSPFRINKFDKDSHGITLLGDARILDREFVRLGLSSTIICDSSVQFVQPTSFTTTFDFSIPPENTDGVLYFHLLKSHRHDWLGIEFNLLSNRVTIKGSEAGSAYDSSVRLSPGLVLNSGKKLRTWIDYDGSANTVEVRLSETGNRRPYDPVLRSEIDFVGDGSVWLSIGAASAHEPTANIYSWTFMSRRVSSRFHSLWMIFGLFVAGVAITKGMKLGFSVTKITSVRSMIHGLFVAEVVVATGLMLMFTITRDLKENFAYLIFTYW